MCTQAVKSLGATLKTFSPTIKELASVTNELSSTLQEQIGLDDIRNEFRNPSPSYSRYPPPSTNPTTTTIRAACLSAKYSYNIGYTPTSRCCEKEAFLPCSSKLC